MATPGMAATVARLSRSYNSFSGVDIQATFAGKPIGELQGLSYTVTREKAPLYTMGSPDPRSFSRGKRGIEDEVAMPGIGQGQVVFGLGAAIPPGHGEQIPDVDGGVQIDQGGGAFQALTVPDGDTGREAVRLQLDDGLGPGVGIVPGLSSQELGIGRRPWDAGSFSFRGAGVDWEGSAGDSP